MVNYTSGKAWRIVARPLIETVLNNHVQHHRVHQTLILHGPRGVGKTTLILERLMEKWNKGPHITGYVDFAQTIEDHHPSSNGSYPWCSWKSCGSRLPELSTLRTQLEECLESMAEKGIELGQITSHQIFSTLNKWHGLSNTLRYILQSTSPSSKSGGAVSSKGSVSVLWEKAVFAYSRKLSGKEIEGVVGLVGDKKGMSVEERSYLKEAVVALRLAKEVIRVQQQWRANAIADVNLTGGFSRSLALAATDWPGLLLELLSSASEIDHFQPKLVINNVELLKHAISTDDTTIGGPIYHDSLIWRIIYIGANEMCLPVILVTSDRLRAFQWNSIFEPHSDNVVRRFWTMTLQPLHTFMYFYYSDRAFIDFGFPDIFISREFFGWTPNEGKIHMVPDYFSSSEWAMVTEVLGTNSRHLFELHALKEINNYFNMTDHRHNTFEDIVDAYLAYLQITVVNPAMDNALSFLQKFALDAHNGKIPKNKLRFGAPWRHPPRSDDPNHHLEWAKIQLMDFVQSLINTGFGLNYLKDHSLEIFDDPATVALLEVGILYAQREPPYLRPVSRGLQRCLVRWLVQEQLQMNWFSYMRFLWQRLFRGRYYRHLL